MTTVPVRMARSDSVSVTRPGMVLSSAPLSLPPSGSSSLGKYGVVKSSGRQTTLAPRLAASSAILTAFRRLSDGSEAMAIWTSPTLNLLSEGIP